MPDKSLVSIIMNCYNGEKYLHQALKSVIEQSYRNWEIIFWDNCSSDRSAEIFKNFKDERFKYFCGEKHCPILYKAKNYALKKAKGDFLAFLDVDDWWHPYKLEKQMPLFKNPKVGMVYGNLWRFFEKKQKKQIYRNKKLPTGMILENLLHDYVIGSPTYMVRKKSLDSLKYHFNNDFHIIGDFDLTVRLASKWEVDCVQEPIATARFHETNVSLLNKNMEIEELKIWYREATKNISFVSKKALKNFYLKILYLETIEIISKEKFYKSFLVVMKFPFCSNKIKLVVTLFLPKFILEKIKN